MSYEEERDGLPGAEDPRLIAAVDMLGRTGATQFQIRYCEEEQPIIWMAAASWDGHWEVAASMSPLDAIFRLCDQVVDGGTCAHCGKPTGFVPDSEGLMPGQELICWYRFDPELKTFRRGCEGVSP